MKHLVRGSKKLRQLKIKENFLKENANLIERKIKTCNNSGNQHG